MSDDEQLPDDPLHTHLYVWSTTRETACCDCGILPELEWAWENTPKGEPGFRLFAIRAAQQLKSLGWRMADGLLFCPDCAALPKNQISD